MWDREEDLKVYISQNTECGIEEDRKVYISQNTQCGIERKT